MRQRCTTAFALALLLGALLAGCASSPTAEKPPREGAPPSYDDVARRYNERAEKLDQVWARAVVRIAYETEDGDTRREQGEGHLQLIQPARLALSIGKLGETLVWLGCDRERYWLFELHDTEQVQVGRHENLGRPCNRRAGLPAHPLDIIELLGVTPLPRTWPGVEDGTPVGETAWSSSGDYLIVDAPGYAGYRRLFLDPQSLLPERIEIFTHPERERSLTAALSEYAPVRIRSGEARPPTATRVIIESDRDPGSITIDLADMTDGRFRSDRLTADVFNFENLVDIFRPARVIVLDERCERSAVAKVDSAQ